MAAIGDRPLNIHAKTRLQHILGRHCRDEDMGLSDVEFVNTVYSRFEKDREATLIDPAE